MGTHFSLLHEDLKWKFGYKKSDFAEKGPIKLFNMLDYIKFARDKLTCTPPLPPEWTITESKAGRFHL
jgi:hypothetical protein